MAHRFVGVRHGRENDDRPFGCGLCVQRLVQAQQRASATSRELEKRAAVGQFVRLYQLHLHAGGPPFQVYLLPQKLPKLVFAGTSTLFFAFINLAKLWPYHALQPYGPKELMGALVLIPFALLGTVAGACLTRQIADDWFFKGVKVGLLAISVKLIVDVVCAG